MHSFLNSGRYLTLRNAVVEMQGDTMDPLGRPRHAHFERVVGRLIAHRPNASIPEIEAALLHDVLTHERGGEPFLEHHRVSAETARILHKIVPPNNANYYQEIEKFTLTDNLDYLDYIRGLVESGDGSSIAVKLADIEDTVDLLHAVGSEPALTQLDRQYEPSRQILLAASVRSDIGG